MKLESAIFELEVETEHEREHAPQNEQWVTSEVCWTPSRMTSSHLISPNTDWFEKSHVEWPTAWRLHQCNLHWRIVDQQVQSWLIWLDHTSVLWNHSTVPWDWWLYGALIWVGNDISWPTCSWSARSPEWPSHCRTDFVNPLTAMNGNLICGQIWNNDCTWRWRNCLYESEHLEILSFIWNFVEAMILLNDTSGLLLAFVIVMLTFCTVTDSAPWPKRHMSERVSVLFCWSDWFRSLQTVRFLGFLIDVFFLFLWLSQSSLWVELEVDLGNGLTCWLRIKDSAFWVVPLENWTLDISWKNKTWGIVVILVIVKNCLLTLLLKVSLACLKQVKLNCILM